MMYSWAKAWAAGDVPEITDTSSFFPSATPLRVDATTPLGTPHTRDLFLLTDEFTYLNHGSFGAAPRDIIEAQRRYQDRMEAQPVRFMDRELPLLLTSAAARLARYIGCEPRDVVPTLNATTGVNAVLRSLSLGPGSVIVTLNSVYPAVLNTINYVASRTGATVHIIRIPIPVQSEDEIVELVRRELPPTAAIAVLDHITSASALVLPVKRLVDVCHASCIPVLIDGAHVPGQLPLNVADTAADYYVGNLHKWMCCPKGSSFLWARREVQADLHPTCVSHGFSQKHFWCDFGFTGTQDYSPFLAISDALRFREALGDVRIMEHNHTLCLWAAKMLAKLWNTNTICPDSMLGAMALIRCPFDHLDRPCTEDDATRVQELLFHNFHIEVPLRADEGKMYVRISVQIYNTQADYTRLGEAILEISRSGDVKEQTPRDTFFSGLV